MDIFYACWTGNLPRVKELLDSTPNNCRVATSCVRMPLHFAAGRNHCQIAILLIENGAPIDYDDWWWSPLHEASLCGRLDMVKLLLLNDARINATTGLENRTPIILAAIRGHFDVTKLLLSNEADVNITCNYGQSPLHYASFNGYRNIVELLLSYRADVNSRNYRGSTPVHQASSSGHIDVVSLLVAAGADIDMQDNDGYNTRQYAIDTEQYAIVKYLEGVPKLISLDEWRPWNHNKYPQGYQQSIQTLCLLAKCQNNYKK